MRRLVLFAAAALLAPVPALADGATFRDGDEQPFCEEPGDCPDNDYMDFRRVTSGHGGGLRHGLRTMKRWKTKELGGPHGVTIYVDFDVDGDRRVEREVRVRRKHGELQARMFRGRYLRKEVEGRLVAWRPDRRSLKVRFPAGLLGDDVESYRWRVFWAQRDLACTGSCHTDSAPDQGWYEHTL